MHAFTSNTNNKLSSEVLTSVAAQKRSGWKQTIAPVLTQLGLLSLSSTRFE